jgi:replicative DNA helicase
MTHRSNGAAAPFGGGNGAPFPAHGAGGNGAPFPAHGAGGNGAPFPAHGAVDGHGAASAAVDSEAPDGAFDPAAHPSPPDIEQALLAAVFLDPDAYARIAPWFHADWLIAPHHRLIAGAMAALHAEGIAPDLAAVHDRLVDTGQIVNVGGWGYLEALLPYAVGGGHLEHYARLVQRRAWRRRVAEAGRRLATLADDPNLDDAALLARVERALTDVQRAPVAPPRAWPDLLDEATADLLRAAARDRVPTGLRVVDARIGGMRRGDLVIIAARPGVGKSALAAAIALNVARAGGRVVFFSLEMSASSVVQRMIAAVGDLDLHRIATQPRADDVAAVAAAVQQVRPLPLVIDDTPTLTVADLRARALALAAQGDLRLVVVDYLQLLAAPDAAAERNRVQEVTAISRALTHLARDLAVPVLALSQLSRESERRQDQVPRLSDLRDSGAIEQDAGLVMLLHRPPPDDSSPRSASAPFVPVDVIIAKHRHGPAGTVSLLFAPHSLRFVDPAPPGVAGGAPPARRIPS